MNTPQEMVARRRRTREAVQRLVSEFKASGLRASEFCRRRGLASSTLRRHLKRAGAGNSAAAQPGVRFVAVKVNGTAPPSKTAPVPAALEVVLASGRRIAVAPGFDVATLGRLVQALEGV
jgi:transposase-like protein